MQLTEALAGLTITAAEQRSIILADLAAKCSGDGDHAADYLNQALDALYNEASTGVSLVAIDFVQDHSRTGREICPVHRRWGSRIKR